MCIWDNVLHAAGLPGVPTSNWTINLQTAMHKKAFEGAPATPHIVLIMVQAAERGAPSFGLGS